MTDGATSLTLRRAMYDRTQELCQANNMRVYRQPWDKSEWSPYQRSIAAAIFRVTLGDAERHETDTAHGHWVSELQTATAAINDVMGEMPEATRDAPPAAKGDRPAANRESMI